MDDEINRRFISIETTVTNVVKHVNEDRDWLLARFDLVEGQLVATMAALHAVIRSAPDPTSAGQKAASAIEQLSATTLHSENSDEFLRGIELVKNALRLPPK